jgi:hypothetical protein
VGLVGGAGAGPGQTRGVERLALYDAFVFEDQVPMFFLWSRAGGLGELLFALFYNERPDERLMLAFYDPSLVNERLAEEVDRALARLAEIAGVDESTLD